MSLTYTLLGTNISPKKALLKIIFLFPRWDMLVRWRVIPSYCFIMFHLFFFSICLSLVLATNGKLVVWVPVVWIPGIPLWKELPRKRLRIRNHQDPSHQFTIGLIEGALKIGSWLFWGGWSRNKGFGVWVDANTNQTWTLLHFDNLIWCCVVKPHTVSVHEFWRY